MPPDAFERKPPPPVFHPIPTPISAHPQRFQAAQHLAIAAQRNPTISPQPLHTPGAFERKHVARRNQVNAPQPHLSIPHHSTPRLQASRFRASQQASLIAATFAYPRTLLPVRAFRCTRSPHLAFAARTHGPALASPKLINRLTANSALSGIAAAHRAPHPHPFASPRFRCVRELLFQADDPRKSALVFHARTSRFCRRRTDKMAHISTPAAGQRFPGRLPV